MATPDMTQEGKIQEAIDTLRKADGKSHLRAPVNELSLKMANIELSHHGYPPLPDDYIALTRQAYGIIGPYLTLLPIGGMETAGGGHQPGMVEASETFNRLNDDDAPKTLVVGRISGGVVITHKDGQYHVVDETSRDALRSYGSIADVIIDTIQRRDKARQAAPPAKTSKSPA